MIKKHTFAQKRTTRKCCALGLAAVVLCGSLTAEVEGELDQLIVSAWRMPGDPRMVTSAVTSLDPMELEKSGVLDLKDALNCVPGVIATSTSGQSGAIGSVFIRGTTTSYSQLVVDGMRVSDATVSLGNFFSGTRVDDLSRIEVLRGPQAAVHGGESVGGVIWLETGRGSGDPKSRLRVEGGSFNSLNGYGSHSGSDGALSWFIGGGYDGSHNDVNQQDFDQARTAMRLEWAQSQDLTIGMTFRAVDSRFQYDSSGMYTDHTDSNLVTAYANARLAPDWTSRFVMGRYQESYDSDSSYGNFGTDLERTVLSSDHSVEISEYNELLFGGFVEYTDFLNTNNAAYDEYRYGTHLGWRWTPTDRLVGDAVVRWEDYADYADQITWRVGGSWQALEKTRLLTGLGKAFKTPTVLDLYGSSFGKGNPNLDAEESLGWDIGIEQDLTDKHQVSLTYFENSIKNQIKNYPTPPVNLDGKTYTRGVEFAANGEIIERVSYQLTWTWLGDSLKDQPENTANGSLDWQVSEKLSLGCGATYVDERSYGGSPLKDYLLLRLYASYDISENITLHARVENLGNESYELYNISGSVVPGAGLGFYTGITATF